MLTTCLYSELDPFTGETPFKINKLYELVENLKLACLLYDRVIVNTNVLLGHPLCLPAFQKLRLFVQSGVLWTTHGRQQDSMEVFMQIQAERLMVNADKNQNDQVERMLEAWLKLAPKQWIMSRNTQQQVSSATRNILQNLQTLKLFAPSSERSWRQLLEKTEAMQEERRFVREELFALLSSLRGTLHGWDKARMAMIVQGEYISQGTHNKGDGEITLFQGRFAQRLYQQQELFAASMPLLDLRTKTVVKDALQAAGYPLQRVLVLPMNALFDFSQSSSWKQWRQNLLGFQDGSKPAAFPIELQYFFTHPKTYLGKNGILPLDNEVAYASSQVLAQTPWLLISLATLGSLALETVTAQTEQHSVPILTIGIPSTLSWMQDDHMHSVYLNPKESALLSILSFFGTDGVPLTVLRQLDIEVITAADDTQHWQTWQSELPETQLARLNKLNVLKHRLNAKIVNSNLQIRVTKRKSIWWLAHLDKPVSLPVTGTEWAATEPDKTHTVPIPSNLTPRQQKAFCTLLEHAPNFVSATLLAETIGEPDMDTKKISDMIYKINQRLSGSFSIIRNHKAEYGLLPTKS